MNFLKFIAKYQYKHKMLIFIIAVIITIILAIGVFRIEMETDFSKMNPTGLEIVELNDKITTEFGGTDIVIILFRFDNNYNFKNDNLDIRDPEIISYLKNLEIELNKESSVEGIISPATYISNFNPQSLSQVKYILSQYPELNSFFSKDFTTTLMYITADLSGDQEKTIAFTEMISEKLKFIPIPQGIEYFVTGSAPISVTILDILGKDAVKTIVIAAIIILLLLFITERSVLKGIVVFSPILLGVIWTIGTMGYLNIKLSVATVGIGAMILGLGVEYGVFMHTRYLEEKEKGLSQKESLENSVPAIGSAILGSGITTIIGFLALTLSIMPMLQDLGKTLALGIFFCLFIAVFISPVIIVLFEDLDKFILNKMYKRYNKKISQISKSDLQ
ncbi:MAG: MMPL family transporter [Candidatus ainarchaeum sp.]|nr:MMPL family transporter [Candidatus ainarchaeum sp.]MDD3976321.1 MMPL family transporter [Candidatus ainarchaeum sp.]